MPGPASVMARLKERIDSVVIADLCPALLRTGIAALATAPHHAKVEQPKEQKHGDGDGLRWQ